MGRYIDAFRRMSKSLDKIAPAYNKSKFPFYIRALRDCILYGVTPNEFIGFGFYKKSHLEKRTFFTARMQSAIEERLNAPKHHDTFWQKQQFNKVFSNWVKREWVYTPESDRASIESFIRTHDKIIVKPVGGSSGKGIHVLKEDKIDDLSNNEYLLESFVKQHHVLSECNPTSVNTIRVYTILDNKNCPHVLSCSLRCGGGGAEVDNYHSGGVGYPIDPEMGYICAAGKNISGEEFLVHPGTGRKMIGLEIPNWKELLEFVFSAAKHLPEARFIAWDVAVLEDGFEMIEANYMGDPGFMQTPLQKGKLLDIKRYMKG